MLYLKSMTGRMTETSSQPAVSAHIRTLEDELGVSLFVRTPKGMKKKAHL